VQLDPQYSADGRSLAYASDRSGSWEIWVSDADGRTATQLTHFGGPLVGTPRWSPDGSSIVFDSKSDGNPDIFVIRPDGGGLRRITTSVSEDVAPSWSRNGKWVYFGSNRSGGFQIWKVAGASGESPSTPAIQVTRRGGFNGIESSDGKYLYFNKDRATGALWRLSLESGAATEEPVLKSLQDWGWWTLGQRRIFFLEAAGPQRPSVARVKFLDQATNRIYELAKSEKPVTWQTPTLTVSPDERSVVFTQIDDVGADIMLMEGFR
jgi:Tol biopolymer transport system component